MRSSIHAGIDTHAKLTTLVAVAAIATASLSAPKALSVNSQTQSGEASTDDMDVLAISLGSETLGSQLVLGNVSWRVVNAQRVELPLQESAKSIHDVFEVTVNEHSFTLTRAPEHEVVTRVFRVVMRFDLHSHQLIDVVATSAGTDLPSLPQASCWRKLMEATGPERWHSLITGRPQASCALVLAAMWDAGVGVKSAREIRFHVVERTFGVLDVKEAAKSSPTWSVFLRGLDIAELPTRVRNSIVTKSGDNHCGYMRHFVSDEIKPLWLGMINGPGEEPGASETCRKLDQEKEAAEGLSKSQGKEVAR